VSHDREFLDGLVTKVYEFGGGKVKEHLGGIYDFLQTKEIKELNELENPVRTVRTGSPLPTDKQSAQFGLTPDNNAPAKNASYAERKERQKQLRKAEKAVEQSERKINDMESRLKELDNLLMNPENASNMELVTEYTSIKRALDEEVERWEQCSEEMERLSSNI
jgi:ATP-binding cassette subfamily F protein 3